LDRGRRHLQSSGAVVFTFGAGHNSRGTLPSENSLQNIPNATRKPSRGFPMPGAARRVTRVVRETRHQHARSRQGCVINYKKLNSLEQTLPGSR
jgi:hypothetical protein